MLKHIEEVHCNTPYARLRTDILGFLLGMHAGSCVVSYWGVCSLWMFATLRLSIMRSVGVCDCATVYGSLRLPSAYQEIICHYLGFPSYLTL